MDQRQTGSENSLASVKQVVAILKEHAHLIFLSSLVLSALCIIAIALLPDVYRATTTILVDPQKIPERYVASTVTIDANGRLNTLTEQVLSASRLEEIIDRNNLYPELRKRKSREEIVDYMRKQIKIVLVQGSDQGLSSFSISFDDRSRLLVAPITNQLAASFIDWNVKERQLQAHDTAQFLSGELERAKQSLEEQESALEAFKMKHVGATPDQLDANMQALSRLQSELQAHMDAIARLDEERIILTQVKPATPSDTATPTTERGRLLQEKLRLEAEIWNLKRQYTDTYPDVITAREELKSVSARLAALPAPPPVPTDSPDASTQVKLTLINKDIERHNQQMDDLKKQIASYQDKVDEVPVLETQLTELSRNYEISRQNYQSLLDKSLSAGMSQDLELQQQAERFLSLDEATTPGRPVQPKRLPMMAATVPMSFLLVSGIVTGISFLLGRVRSEEELKEVLPDRVQILSIIPTITSRADLKFRKIKVLQSIAALVVVCVALIVFLHKVKPIL
jgi:polysaccharide biosynthesis transport protein